MAAHGIYRLDREQQSIRTNSAGPLTVCGNITLGNDSGWFLTSSNALANPTVDPAPTAQKAYAAWPLAADQIAAVDEQLTKASACTGVTNAFSETGEAITVDGFDSAVAQVHGTDGTWATVTTLGRVGHLLMMCGGWAADSSAAGTGIPECLGRATQVAQLAQGGDLSTTVNALIPPMLGGRVELAGWSTYPSLLSFESPCVQDPSRTFVAIGDAAMVEFAETGKPVGGGPMLAVQGAESPAAAHGDVEAFTDLIGSCTGEFQPPPVRGITPPTRTLHGGTPTDTGDGGIRFTSTENRSSGPMHYAVEIFSIGAYKYQAQVYDFDSMQSAESRLTDLLTAVASATLLP